MAEGYRGVFGAFPFALRASDSLLFKLWVVVSALATLLIGGFVVLGLVFLFGQTAGVPGGSLTLSRAFYVVVGLFLVAPVVAPTLLVARRHRRGLANERDPTNERYDRLLALSGFLFLVLLYVGLVATVPPDQQQAVGASALAPVVTFLYDLPQLAGLVFPAVGAVVVYLAHRLAR
jgi:hypothetical protein